MCENALKASQTQKTRKRKKPAYLNDSSSESCGNLSDSSSKLSKEEEGNIIPL